MRPLKNRLAIPDWHSMTRVLAPGSEDLRDDRKALQRLCVATREVKPVDGLLRFVVSPAGRVVSCRAQCDR